MENLIRHTANLVARHNCVILPGVGAFIAHDVPASYNAVDGVFMPPHRTLAFNSQVLSGDALLQAEYMNCGCMSFEEAGAAMTKEIAAFRENLSAESVMRFGELGTFTMNINGEISFAPGENGIDDPVNFGFEPLVIPLLKKCEEKVIVIPRHNLSRYVAIAAAVILAFFVVTPMSDNAYQPSMQAGFSPAKAAKQHNSAPVAEICEIAPVTDTATENITTAMNLNTENATATIEPSAGEEPAAATGCVGEQETSIKNCYHIIVASSPNAENAQLAIKELTAKMQAGYSVVQCGKRHRISIGSFNSNSEANAALSQIKSCFPDAWILVLQ